MAKVIIALGSNLNDPKSQLTEASAFLESLSKKPVRRSSVYRSEPVGPSDQDYLNTVAVIESELDPGDLLKRIKDQERRQGRPSRYPKWTARTIDMDIIAWDDLVIESDNLIIPHPEYSRRMFVLMPLKELEPEWKDPVSAQHIDLLINEAEPIRIEKTSLTW